MSKNKDEYFTNSLIIGDFVYKTEGNILFSSSDNYFLAESPILQKMNEATSARISENGMQAFFRKISGAE